MHAGLSDNLLSARLGTAQVCKIISPILIAEVDHLHAAVLAQEKLLDHERKRQREQRAELQRTKENYHRLFLASQVWMAFSNTPRRNMAAIFFSCVCVYFPLGVLHPPQESQKAAQNEATQAPSESPSDSIFRCGLPKTIHQGDNGEP